MLEAMREQEPALDLLAPRTPLLVGLADGIAVRQEFFADRGVFPADMPPIEQKSGQGKSNGRPSCRLMMCVQLRWWIHIEAASVPSQSKIQPRRESRAGSKGGSVGIGLAEASAREPARTELPPPWPEPACKSHLSKPRL